jgi:hypothetical protein
MKRQQAQKRHSRLRDLTLYVSIALAVVIAGFLYAVYSGSGSDERLFMWIAFSLNTLILFGYSVRRHDLLNRRILFPWGVITALSLIHLSIWISVLRHVQHVGLVWFLVMYPIEEPIIDKVLSWWRPLSKRSWLKRWFG